MLNTKDIEDLFPFENEDEVYILLALARRKYNPNISKTIVFSEIVESPSRWTYKIHKLLKLADAFPFSFNLYVSQNPRSIRKALFVFKSKLVQFEFEGWKLHIEKLKRLDSLWKSCLQTKFSRARKQYFIVDIDTRIQHVVEDVRKTLEKQDVQIVKINETRSGVHILCKPFNERLISSLLSTKFSDEVEILKDSNFFIMEI